MTALRRIAAVVVLTLSLSAAGATFTVTSSQSGFDDTPGTLRQAILSANANPGPDQIRFAVASVVLSANQPAITDTVDIQGPVEIIVPFLSDPQLVFQFAPGSSGSSLRQIVITDPVLGINIQSGVTNVTIQNNLAVYVRVSGNQNLITDNSFGGDVFVQGDANQFLRNDIRLLQLFFADDNRVGSTGNGNRINELTNESSSRTIVEGNTFPAGTTAITIRNFQPPAVGIVISGNTISSYSAAGIALPTVVPPSVFAPPPLGVTITGNRIFNTGIPIDLGGDGPTPNDPAPDADLGANNLQNYPVLTSAELHPTSLVVSGTLTSAPLTTYVIELFSDIASDPEARTPLGTFEVTTDAAGTATFSHTVTSSLPPPEQVITSTARNRTTGDTSEVSAAIALESHLPDHAIPTASGWGLIAMAIALAAITLLRLSR